MQKEKIENNHQKTKVSSDNYVGNASYCYANSTAMLLSSLGENISPSLIEVLTGVGLGTSIVKGKLFFSHPNLEPDIGIMSAMRVLGFEAKMHVFTEKDNPFPTLEKNLNKSPAILGPLEMYHLTYNPGYPRLKGVDHFVLVYQIKGNNVYLHDPAGFPYAFISREKLKKAWRAEGVRYKRGFYRYITEPKRKNKTNSIYENAICRFKDIYKNCEIISKIENISRSEINHFTHFALPLGARRALDFAGFFKQPLKKLKQRQAKEFGKAQTYAMLHNIPKLKLKLNKIVHIEKQIKQRILAE